MSQGTPRSYLFVLRFLSPPEVAREIAESLGSGCRFVECNILNMPFSQHSFVIALFPLNILEFAYGDIETLCQSLNTILSPDGLFCLTMQDGLRRMLAETPTEPYNPIDGRQRVFHTIPGQGKYEYQSYFWTLAFVRHLIAKYFDLEQQTEYAENRYLLVYRNR